VSTAPTAVGLFMTFTPQNTNCETSVNYGRVLASWFLALHRPAQRRGDSIRVFACSGGTRRARVTAKEAPTWRRLLPLNFCYFTCALVNKASSSLGLMATVSITILCLSR
jgi:hypothetical protein